MCENAKCDLCFKKSFSSHEKSKYLLDKNIDTRIIFNGTHDKYIFKCNFCNHSFESSINKITGSNRWCPYCCIPVQKLCEINNCNFCFNNSFASHEKSKYWSKKNLLLPRNVIKKSEKKYFFDCNKCKREFIMMICNVFKGCWCPYCVNKTEQKLYDKLITLYPTLQQQFKVDWCKNKTYLPFDFVIPENKIIIELDGRQHFEQVRNWDDPKKTQDNDKYKMKCANDNNYSVIRILQEDVFYDSYDWLYELNDNIKNITQNKKVENIYMCKDNEYDVFN